MMSSGLSHKRGPLGGFRRSSQRPSWRQICLSETLGPVATNRVAF